MTQQDQIQVKRELDSLEWTQNEELKKFKGHNMEFDFYTHCCTFSYELY